MKAHFKDTYRMLKLSGRVMLDNPVLWSYILASVLALGALCGLGYAAGDRVLALVESPQSWGVKMHPESPLTRIFMRVEKKETVETGPDGGTRRVLKITGRTRWFVGLIPAVAVLFPFAYTMIFFNAALLVSVRKILNGGETSFGEGVAAAWERRVDIAWWALFSTTVGLALNAIKGASDNFLTRRLFGGLTVAWNLATYLVVPVLAVEGGSPRRVFARSGELFKKTWGQTVAGSVSLTLIPLVVFLVSLAAGVKLFMIGSHHDSTAGMWSAFAVFFAPTAAALFICHAAGLIFRMALYVYATEGVVPEEYAEDGGAWFVSTKD